MFSFVTSCYSVTICFATQPDLYPPSLASFPYLYSVRLSSTVVARAGQPTTNHKRRRDSRGTAMAEMRGGRQTGRIEKQVESSKTNQ
jgi:hypothetical protein